jgi:hypothetical protein
MRRSPSAGAAQWQDDHRSIMDVSEWLRGSTDGRRESES